MERDTRMFSRFPPILTTPLLPQGEAGLGGDAQKVPVSPSSSPPYGRVFLLVAEMRLSLVIDICPRVFVVVEPLGCADELENPLKLLFSLPPQALKDRLPHRLAERRPVAREYEKGMEISADCFHLPPHPLEALREHTPANTIVLGSQPIELMRQPFPYAIDRAPGGDSFVGDVDNPVRRRITLTKLPMVEETTSDRCINVFLILRWNIAGDSSNALTNKLEGILCFLHGNGLNFLRSSIENINVIVEGEIPQTCPKISWELLANALHEIVDVDDRWWWWTIPSGKENFSGTAGIDTKDPVDIEEPRIREVFCVDVYATGTFLKILCNSEEERTRNPCR
jgi:hypothetical protein